ncbi:MAG: hypothetical protein IPJ65_26215 [Archangiaceae bacterium]|nr:hypothetical protein [Archangiaceae bacterium]
MRRVLAVAIALGAGCVGPPASDAAICRDVAHRMCISECGTVYNQLGLTSVTTCDQILNARTGCNDEGFTFVSRDNFLSCRLPILRAGEDVETVPSCEDVDDMFRGCPSMLTFYRER